MFTLQCSMLFTTLPLTKISMTIIIIIIMNIQWSCKSDRDLVLSCSSNPYIKERCQLSENTCLYNCYVVLQHKHSSKVSQTESEETTSLERMCAQSQRTRTAP